MFSVIAFCNRMRDGMNEAEILKLTVNDMTSIITTSFEPVMEWIVNTLFIGNVGLLHSY